MRHDSIKRPSQRRTRAPLRSVLTLSTIFLLMALLGVGVTASDQSHKSTDANDASALTAKERKVIEYLQNDWGKDYSVTSLDIAMEAVGLPPSDEVRFKIGNYIKAHPELHEVIRRWGWVTLVLTPNEKLIARALINAARAGEKTPSLAELARAVGISEAEAQRGLEMLQRYEILQREESVGGVGYAVEPHYMNWEPRLDFLFHTVTLSSGRRFNTN